MYQSLKTNITAILILSTLICANHAVAKDCYEQSPNLVSLGDKYYDFDNIKTFSYEEKDKLTNFSRNLSGKWKGKSVIIGCFGPDNAPQKKLKNAIIKTRNQPNANGGLTINVNQKILEDRVNNSENLTLLNPPNTFEFAFLSDNHLIFSEKYRRGNLTKTDTNDNKIKSSRLIEIIFEIRLDNGSFTLLRSYYTNGVYTGEEQWTMGPN